MSLYAQFEQALAAGLAVLDDRINGRIKALEKKVDDLAIRVGALEKAQAPAVAATPRGQSTTARAGSATGKAGTSGK
jgi:hypothetical protein